MASSYILSDNGASSGSAGLKTTAGNDGKLILQTATSGGTATDAVTIDTSQNVGIGTSSPVSKVHAYGSGQLLTLESNADLSTSAGSSFLRFKGTNGNSGYIGFGGTANTLYVSNALSGPMIFETIGAERMRIDSSGKIGIGTSAPGCSLQVEGGIRARGGAPGSAGANNNGFAFETNGDNDSGMFCLADGQLDFFTNNVESVRIDSSTNVTIGDVASVRAAKLNVIAAKGSGGTWSQRVLLIEDSTTSTDGQPGIGFHAPKNSNATIFKMYGPTSNFECRNSTDTGFVAILASAFTPSSDYRVKSNVENLESTIEKVLKLRPVSYEKEGVDGIEYGLIAHEAAEHFPNIVKGEKDAMRDDGTMDLQTVNYMALTAVLTKAIQEQQALITTLTERITALEAK